MPNILFSGEYIPSNLSIDLIRDCAEMMLKLGFAEDDAVITLCGKDYNESGENILLYGFDFVDPYSSDELPYKIMKESQIVTTPVKSWCRSICKKETATSPHIVLITSKEKRGHILSILKEMKVGYDTEVHLIGSNVFPKEMDGFFVRVKVLEQEAEQLECIIKGLMSLGISRDQIWASIIEDFIPANEMK